MSKPSSAKVRERVVEGVASGTPGEASALDRFSDGALDHRLVDLVVPALAGPGECKNVWLEAGPRGAASIQAGHFFPEEAPERTAEAMSRFFGR
jgi:hypothetical protein